MDISWYETTLFTDDGAPSYIPNAVFISSTIVNENRRKYRLFVHTLHVDMHDLFSSAVDPPSVKLKRLQMEITERLRNVTEYVVPASKISVDAMQFTEVGLTVKVKVFVDVTKLFEEAQVRTTLTRSYPVAQPQNSVLTRAPLCVENRQGLA